MKFGLIVIATLVASAFAAHFLLQDPGYVVIGFRGYLIEMSVPRPRHTSRLRLCWSG